MLFTVGDADKAGQKTLIIKTDMDFDSPFGTTKFRPRENRKAQINRSGVQRIPFVLETKPVFWHCRVTSR